MKITRQSLIYLLFCLTGVAIYVLAGLLPLFGAAREYEDKINLLKKKIEAQEEALPLYQNLKRRLDDQAPQQLPFPAPGKISRDNVGNLKRIIQELAEKNNLTAVLIDPDLAALIKGTPRILVATEMKGDLFDFRNYLIALNTLPYLTGLAEMQILQAASGMVLKLKLYIEVS